MDTDIGSNVDDLFALAFLLASPELELTGIGVVSGDVHDRGRLARLLLGATGRGGIPVALGHSNPLAPGATASDRPCGHGLDVAPTGCEAFDPRPATALLLDTVRKHGGNLSVVGTGPLTNLASFARDHPYAFRSLRAVSLMGGSFLGVDARSIRPETNFALDPEAADVVLASGADVLLHGLNVTRPCLLSREEVEQLAALRTPRADLLARCAMHFLDCTGRVETPMHDSVAVATLVCPDLICYRPLPVRVQTVGPEAGVLICPEESKNRVRVAVKLDTDRFHALFWERITAFASES